ncbi:hypothetical protein GCM10028808_65470 [Spirosoma migulaei]
MMKVSVKKGFIGCLMQMFSIIIKLFKLFKLTAKNAKAKRKEIQSANSAFFAALAQRSLRLN